MNRRGMCTAGTFHHVVGSPPKATFENMASCLKLIRGARRRLAREIRRSMAHDQSNKSSGSKTAGPAADAAPARTGDAKAANSKKGRKDAKATAPATPGLQPPTATTPPSPQLPSKPVTTELTSPPQAGPNATTSGKAASGPVSLASLAEPRAPLSFLTPEPQTSAGAGKAKSIATPPAPPPLPGAKTSSADGPPPKPIPTPPGLPAGRPAADPATSSPAKPAVQASAGSGGGIGSPSATPTPSPDLSAMRSSAPSTPAPPPRPMAAAGAGGPTLAFAAPAEPAAQPDADNGPHKIDIEEGTRFGFDEAGDADLEDTENSKRIARRRPAGPVRGKVAAALGLDAGNLMQLGGFHYGHAGLCLNDLAASVGLDESDLGHGIGGCSSLLETIG